MSFEVTCSTCGGMVVSESGPLASFWKKNVIKIRCHDCGCVRIYSFGFFMGKKYDYNLISCFSPVLGRQAYRQSFLPEAFLFGF